METTNTTKVPKYRKKPILVEAVQITVENLPLILGWGEGYIDTEYNIGYDVRKYTVRVTITTTTGRHTATEGDWIVKGVNGQFYAMPDETFQTLYEPEDAPDKVDVIKW